LFLQTEKFHAKLFDKNGVPAGNIMPAVSSILLEKMAN